MFSLKQPKPTFKSYLLPQVTPFTAITDLPSLPCPACPGRPCPWPRCRRGLCPLARGLCPLARGWRTAPVEGLPGPRALRGTGKQKLRSRFGVQPLGLRVPAPRTDRARPAVGKQDFYQNKVSCSLKSGRARLFWKVVSYASGVWARFARSAGRDEEKAAGAALLCG